MNNECPVCFANIAKSGKLEACSACIYLDSCKYCAQNSSAGCSRGSGQVSYDRYSYSREVATEPDFSDAPPPASSSADDTDTQKILEFLLDLDNYSAELLHAVLHCDCNSTADLAKQFDVSRQAIHRKIVDCCTLHPALRKLFIARLPRCKRILSDSNRFPQKNINQLELF